MSHGSAVAQADGVRTIKVYSYAKPPASTPFISITPQPLNTKFHAVYRLVSKFFLKELPQSARQSHAFSGVKYDFREYFKL